MTTLIRKKAACRAPGGKGGAKAEAQCCAKLSPVKAGCHD